MYIKQIVFTEITKNIREIYKQIAHCERMIESKNCNSDSLMITLKNLHGAKNYLEHSLEKTFVSICLKNEYIQAVGLDLELNSEKE